MRHAETQEVQHGFEARGVASLVRLLRDTTLIWRGRTAVQLVVEPGTELRAGHDSHELITDSVRIQPHGLVVLRAQFPQAAYLVSIRRVLNTLLHHFVLNIRLEKGWHDNIWPEYLDHYLRQRNWPDSARELTPIFSAALRRGTTAEQTKHIRSQPWKERIRRGTARTLQTRLGREPIARGLAREHWKEVSRAFFNSEHHDAMVDAAELARRLRSVSPGCTVIQADWASDQLTPTMPPKLAFAQSIQLEGPASIEVRDERRQRIITHVNVSEASIDSGGGLGVRGGVEVQSAAAHVCLLSGAKTAYGATMPAPIICKGQRVQSEATPHRVPWWRRLHHWQAAWRNADWTCPEADDPQHLYVTTTGEEA